MSNSYDDDLQNTVMDFINYPVVADANAPGAASFEFFYIRWARVGFQFGQSG
jgi:hypothetical protein